MDLIVENVKQILPALEVDKVTALVARLEELGATDINDLVLVEEKDFEGIIKPIQARKIINAWKSTEPPKISVFEEERCAPTSSTSTSKDTSTVTVVDSEWADNFTVPWHKMPGELLDSLKDKQRPKPNLRLHMVRVICSLIKEVCENPGKNALTKIAKTIVLKYPESFGDILCGEMVCGGYASLAKQLVNRFQNLNRDKSLNVLKRKKKNEISGVDVKKICTSDQYGCVNWQPGRLPDEETHVSQEKKKEDMKIMFKQGPLFYKSSNFITLLNDTYYTQRKEINKKQPTDYLIKEWPLLFTTEGFLNHFNTLVGINIVEKFHSALVNKGRRISQFIETKPTGCSKKEVENVLKEVDMSEDLVNSCEFVIFLMVAYFGEKRESLFKTADNSTTAQEVRNMKDLPSTPCLIICGETEYSGTSFILCVDTIVINQDIEDFETGLLMLFASYYCMNIQYPHTAAATLEFIQRCFLNINPTSGTKVSKDVKKKHQVFNAKVLTLLKGIADYEWVAK